MTFPWQAMFWSSIAILAYTYLGYPIVLWLLTRLRRCPPTAPTTAEPYGVQVVVVVRNEAERILDRIANLLDTEFPEDSLSILIVSDGSSDDTVQRVENLGDPRVRVLDLPENRGKAAGLAAAMEAAEAEILVFTDVRQRFQPTTIPRLVAHFADARVGAVSGALLVGHGGDDSVGRGVDAYWRLEKWIRAHEAVWDSSVGCTGAVYAARRECLTPIPADTILDDVIIPMGVALKGYRILFEPEAVAIDPQDFSAEKETGRKERTLGGNFQMLLRYPGWLLPWRNRLWWQLISHKHLRVLAPLFFATALVANLALARESLYMVLLIGHLLFYLAAVIGGLAGEKRLPIFIRYPTTLVFLNVRVVRGLFRYLRGDYSRGWREQASKQAP
jgi:cellulose synthase/poly-beta-1,6-N-acetylglucosamine synthase-like glycosyltransferase